MPEPDPSPDNPLPPIRWDLLKDFPPFVKAVRSLLSADADHVPIQHYNTLRNKVFLILEDEKFLAAITKAWNELKPEQDDVKDAMLEELRAFSGALESANAEEKKNPDVSWWSASLGWASTSIGSLKDILEETPYVKNVLTLFKEVVDIFRGKEESP
jgi:hypothetical protein